MEVSEKLQNYHFGVEYPFKNYQQPKYFLNKYKYLKRFSWF